ncbi:BRI1 kinase inhibitor 1-like [Tripterygium wilfordii]|uniref:BRI1 kinase inhibitor 1-like n=1 Tax=Tripterygium wilfordii TaxID=458696 RepID=A0A7J7DL50_TRIWF|nr:BRI1 kinase inhibitor 1-like [Tripterygium wilfordii]KAF5747057.1 BRI1 kinase inhibitor 1-like [Tripterygium wilfordii]
MDTHQSQQKVLDKYDEDKLKHEVKEGLTVAATTAAAATSPASIPSAASSPSHEFSFTISLHSSSTPVPEKAKPPASFAIDLSPADEIFFHGHLLPLHLLSHLPVSPRTSTNSMDSFTLPIRELMDDSRPTRNSSISNSDSILNGRNKDHKHQGNDCETQGRSKNKSFSLFRLTRRRKGCEVTEKEDKEKNKRRIRFDVNHVLKKYVRMIRALPFFREKRENLQFHRQAHSFSGGLSSKTKHEIRRGEFSAPASMRTSPTNSGLLVATTTLPSSTSDSTMEELQAAIQAAIAHCKNSIAKEEKIKC